MLTFPKTAANTATAYVSDIDKKPSVYVFTPLSYMYAWKPVKSGGFQVYFEGRKKLGFHFTYEFHACSWTVKRIL